MVSKNRNSILVNIIKYKNYHYRKYQVLFISKHRIVKNNRLTIIRTKANIAEIKKIFKIFKNSHNIKI